MTRTFVVKGSRFTAARAAADRGIPAAFLREVDAGEPTHVSVFVTVAEVEELNAWLCEPPTEPPFPAGAMLLWSEHPDKAPGDFFEEEL